jgi:hypothetical protein
MLSYLSAHSDGSEIKPKHVQTLRLDVFLLERIENRLVPVHYDGSEIKPKHVQTLRLDVFLPERIENRPVPVHCDGR